MTESVAWVKWHFAKWRGDPMLRMCSLTARGLWIELLAVMHECEPYGHLVINGKAPTTKQIASIVGMTNEKEVASALRDLLDNGVCSETDDGVIYSRRLVRDKEVRDQAVADGLRGGSPDIRRGTVPKDQRIRPYKRSDSPKKTDRIFAKTDGHCFWCGIALQREVVGPDFFHVDHFVAVCDGGTNDEENLVPACARCNHSRARDGHPTGTPNAGNGSHHGGSDTNGRNNPTPTVGMQSDSNGRKISDTPSDRNSDTSDRNSDRNSDRSPSTYPETVRTEKEREEREERVPPPIVPPLVGMRSDSLFGDAEPAKAAKRQKVQPHRLPVDWMPRKQETDLAQTYCINLKTAIADFCHYWRDPNNTDPLRSDWDRTFANFLGMPITRRRHGMAPMMVPQISQSNPDGRRISTLSGGL